MLFTGGSALVWKVYTEYKNGLNSKSAMLSEEMVEHPYPSREILLASGEMSEPNEPLDLRRRRRPKTPKGPKYDNDAIGGAVSSVVDIAAFAKDPNVQTGGAALASAGAAVMMIPAPPFSQAIGAAMALAGGMMQVFGEKQDSDELAYMK
jgi:hypothetical protein